MKFKASLKTSLVELIVYGVCLICCYTEQLRVIWCGGCSSWAHKEVCSQFYKHCACITAYSQLRMLCNRSYDRQQYLTASRRCRKWWAKPRVLLCTPECHTGLEQATWWLFSPPSSTLEMPVSASALFPCPMTESGLLPSGGMKSSCRLTYTLG